MLFIVTCTVITVIRHTIEKQVVIVGTMSITCTAQVLCLLIRLVVLVSYNVDILDISHVQLLQ